MLVGLRRRRTAYTALRTDRHTGECVLVFAARGFSRESRETLALSVAARRALRARASFLERPPGSCARSVGVALRGSRVDRDQAASRASPTSHRSLSTPGSRRRG